MTFADEPGDAGSGERDPTRGELVGRAKPGAMDVLARTAQWILPAYALLFVPFLVERLDPSTDPRIDLTGTVALVAWLFAESGQTLGIVPIAGALIIVLVTRPRSSHRARLVEAAVVIAVSILVLYGGKLVNDHVVKPAVGVARPDIVQLAELDLLGTDVDSFYELSQEDRSGYLENIKDETGFGEIVMRAEVRDHWVKETAFSRPSGHALASMTFATYYLSMALSVLSGWRRWTFHLLVPWAVCVSLSRPILRVHWPEDIVLGGAAGIVLGAAGYSLTRFLLLRLAPLPPP